MYNKVYGRYSLGSGSILKDPNSVFSSIDTAEVISAYQNVIERDLLKMGIDLKSLKDMVVMDVGTGRQAIAFHRFGTKKVDHYDISEQNVIKMQEYIKNNALFKSIESKHCDIVKTLFF